MEIYHHMPSEHAGGYVGKQRFGHVKVLMVRFEPDVLERPSMSLPKANTHDTHEWTDDSSSSSNFKCSGSRSQTPNKVHRNSPLSQRHDWCHLMGGRPAVCLLLPHERLRLRDLERRRWPRRGGIDFAGAGGGIDFGGAVGLVPLPAESVPLPSGIVELDPTCRDGLLSSAVTVMKVAVVVES